MRTLWLIMLSCCLNISIAGQSPTVINVATESWVDYTNLDGTGGYFEMLHLIYPADQYQLNSQFMPFGRSIDLVEKGQADIVLSVAVEDSNLLLRSALPIDTDRIVAVSLKTSTPIRYEQLNSLRLSWRLAYNYGDVLHLTASGYEVPNVEQGLRLVLNKRVDVYLAEYHELFKPVFTEWFDTQLQQDLIRITPIYIGFAPTPQGQQLKALWDKRWQQLQQSNALKALYEKYPGLRLPQP